MSTPVSFIECVSNMAYTRVLSCVMLALISSIIASIQLNHAIIDIQENYKRRRLKLSRLLSTTTSTFTRVKRLRWRRESKERRFWTRPGRHFSSLSITTNARDDFTTWTLTLDNKALRKRLQAQIDSACAFGVWHRFMRLRAFSCGRVKTLRKRWSFSCGRK